MKDLSTGYTWDEAPKNLKEAALHLSDALKIDKIEAYQMILEKMTYEDLKKCADRAKKSKEALKWHLNYLVMFDIKNKEYKV